MQKLASGLKKLKWITPIALALGSVLFALLLCELILRLFFPQSNLYLRGLYIKDDQVGYRPVPNYQGKLSDLEFKISVNTNSFGFRDLERVIDKSAYRILGLGDSFTFGLAINFEDTYLHQLEKLLNKNLTPSRFQLFNLGVPGYGVNNEYHMLEKYISLYKPHLLLVGFFTGNDVRDAMLGLGKYDLSDGMCVWNQKIYQNWMKFDARQGEWTSTGAVQLPPLHKMSIFDRVRRSLKAYLRPRSHLYQLMAKSNQLRQLVNSANVESRPLSIFEYEAFWLKRDSEVIQEGYKTAFDYLLRMKKLSEANGAKLILVLIPPKEQVHEVDWERSKKKFMLKEEELDRYKPQRLIKEWASKNQVETIDLLDDFRDLDAKGKRLYFYKDGHWNAEGHKRTSELIYQYLTLNAGKLALRP